MKSKLKGLILFLVSCLVIIGCSDDEQAGKIKTVYTYNEEHELRRKESYEYDVKGKLVKERVKIDNTTEFTREFTYEENRLVKFTERSIVVDFYYDLQGELTGMGSQTLGLNVEAEDGHILSAGNKFVLNYDNHHNLESILHSDEVFFFMARGSYSYDDKKYIYNSFPVALRYYYALFRTENQSLASDIFRLNPGSNNIKHLDLYDNSGEIESYYVFDYKYGFNGYPQKLDLLCYHVNSAGSAELSYTYYYKFEYY